MERKKKKRRFRLFHLICIFLLFYVSIVFIHQQKLMKSLEAKKTENMLEVKDLEKEIKQLEKEIENSDSLEFVEKVARDELGMVKPKEIIYVDKNKTKNPFFNLFKKDN